MGSSFQASIILRIWDEGPGPEVCIVQKKVGEPESQCPTDSFSAGEIRYLEITYEYA